MARILILALAVIVTLAATVDFPSLRSAAAPSAEDIRLAFDRGLAAAPDGQIQTVITGPDPSRCVSKTSPIYSGGVFRCRVRLETALPTGERHASDAALTLAPFEHEWTVVALNANIN